jgi:hypothetical protein
MNPELSDIWTDPVLHKQYIILSYYRIYLMIILRIATLIEIVAKLTAGLM